MNSYSWAQVKDVKPRMIKFSGYEWLVRNSNDQSIGPGPNFFSNSSENVWIDEEGRLHLKITQKEGIWHCAEVTLKKSLGYGKYTFILNSELSTLDKNVVVGLFTYLNDHEEIDIEFSKWSDANNLNAQFVIQPHEIFGNSERFQLDKGLGKTEHSFDWQKKYIDFKSQAYFQDQYHLIHEWRYKGQHVPRNKKERLKINIWLFKGQAPSDAKEHEVVIDRVIYSRR